MFGWLAASVFLLTTACSDNVALDVAQGDTNGANTVTFTIMPQTQELATRAKGDLDTRNKYISDGTKADILIFAVYKKSTGTDGNEIWTPDPEFSKGSQVTGISTDDLGYAQNAIEVDKYPVTIQFYVTDNEAEYKVAFWAQSKDCKAYDTRNLQRVKVNYKDALNNDELRDAFCAVTENVFTGNTKETQEVTLRRPLAQVNVGTAGWDYEGAAFLKPSPVSYTQSKITLSGVAQYYDILTGSTLDETALNAAIEANPKDFGEEGSEDRNPTTDATFDFNLIPAFIQDTAEEWKTTYKPVTNEEFLQVDVNRNGQIDGYWANDKNNQYVGWDLYDGYRKGNSSVLVQDEEGNYIHKTSKDLYNEGIMPTTEMYKYLSMCYVLVPTQTTNEDGSSTLNKVTFEAKGSKETAKGEDTSGEEDVVKTVFTIHNVPVRKNWRTNILGNDFFTAVTTFHLDIVPEYFGDYNYNGWEYGTPDQGGSWPEEKTYTVTFNGQNNESTDGFFKFYGKHNFGNGKYTGTYNGTSFTSALKMEGSTEVEFKVPIRSEVLIAQCTTTTSNGTTTENTNTIKINDEPLPISSATTPDNSKNVRLYVVSVPAGTHKITRGNGESGIFSVEVNTVPKTIYPNIFVIGEDEDGNPETGDFDDKYPDYNPKPKNENGNG